MANTIGNKHMRGALLGGLVTCGLVCALGAGGAGAETGAHVVTADQREALAVTVYNQNLALVRDVRRIELPTGEFFLEFQDVPAQIEPRSLVVETDGRSGLRLLEQNYEFDLMSRDKILEKYVGREIVWLQEDGETSTGRLLGMAAGPVYEVDDRIVFRVPGRISLPTLPGDLRARPTLVWRARTERGGAETVEASYLTRGISWSADYVLQLDPEGRRGSLRSWISVDNRSGAAYADAKLLLVAGEINQAAPVGRGRPEMMLAMASKGVSDEVQEESLYDYHLYTVPGTTLLKDAQIKQISLFEADEVGVTRHYRLEAPRHYYRGGGGNEKPKVGVFYSFENDVDNHLGRPLPAGVFRVYGQSEAGDRQLLGEDRIDHTPRKEEVELRVGVAFDIAAERTRLDYRRPNDRTHETDYRVVLRNHKEDDIVVEIIEAVGGVWRVLRSSHEPIKTAADRLRFDVPVPADGETVVTWTVQVTSR